MANELKPCPFCGAPEVEIMIIADQEEATDNSGPSRRIQCAVCNIEAPFYPSKSEAITAWNTRPAVPVEGLETVETQMRCLLQTGNHQWRNPRLPSELSFIKTNGKDETGIPYELRELVTLSQAEAIIAAERAKVRHWQEQYTEMHSQFIDLAKSAEADNAALTARVKELEKVNAKLCDDAIDYELKVAERDISLKALETQLAAMKKALEKLTLHSNSLALAHVHKTQKNDGIWGALKEARAALEVKP